MAAGLTDAALPKGNCAVRIMLFVGGPTTEGGGQVVDKELSEPIRSHKARCPSNVTPFLFCSRPLAAVICHRCLCQMLLPASYLHTGCAHVSRLECYMTIWNRVCQAAPASRLLLTFMPSL